METLTHKFSTRHNEIRKLLNQIDKVGMEETDGKRVLLESLRSILNAHLSAEEAILYRKIDELGDLELSLMTARSREEHALIDHIHERMNQSWPNSTAWRALFDILKDVVEMYLRREETRLLPISDKVFSSHQLQNLIQKTEETENDWRRGIRNARGAKFWEVPQ